MVDIALLYPFAVALGIGLLIGIQREYAFEHFVDAGVPSGKRRGLFAGTRTFPLLAGVGWLAAFSAELLGSPIAFVAFTAPALILIVAAYYVTSRNGDVGMTTEVTAIITVAIGALCFWEHLLLALIIGVTTMTLLTFKLELHRLTQQITQEDVVATLKFAIISAIVLPVLPATPLGDAPFDVLNLRKIWLMVVFISGIGFSGYVLIKLVGARRGIGLSGFLGGLVSSTAVTLTFAQRSHTQDKLVKPFALAIIISWTVMFARVLVEVAVVNRTLLAVVWLPLTVTALVALGFGFYLYWGAASAETEHVDVSNPFELTPAIQFALLYGIILLAANAAQLYFGAAGIYFSSILSGLADVDAITLSMADLSRSGTVAIPTAARAIMFATMSNTVVKSGIVLLSGTRKLRQVIMPGIALILLSGTAIAFLLI